MHDMAATSRRRALVAAGLTALAALGAAPALAQDYPSRPIEMTVTWGPGGGADQTGRRLAKLLEPQLKVSMPVENVAGSSGVTGLTKLLNAPAEGYQVGILTADTYALLAEKKPQRWSLKDLDVIAVLIVQQSGFFTASAGPLKSWADVEAKAKTTELKVAVTGFGTPDDLAVEQLKKRGLKLNSVPFAKPGERYAAVVGGHADLLYEQAGDIRSFIEGKQLQPVMFLANAKVAQFPTVTISKEIGLELTLDQFRTVVARSGTPPDRLKRLVEAVGQVTRDPDYAKFLDEQWADPKSVVLGAGAVKIIETAVNGLKVLQP
jgi:tripartite-type tricarboxylate transporter receptor subunit TctC